MKPKKTIAALLLMLSAGSASAMQASETTTHEPPATPTVAAFQAQLFEGKSDSLALMALSDQEMKETKGAYLPLGISNMPLPPGLRSWLDWRYWDAGLVRLHEQLRPGCAGTQCVPREQVGRVLGLHLL